jgi:glutathione S-transferase
MHGVLLYDSAVSGNCYKVRLLLAHLGLPFERVEVDVVDRSGRQELLGELNPGLRVPTLVLDDGRPLGESDAILMYLAEGTPYVPEDRYLRAQVLQWLFFEQYSHEPYIAVVRYWLTVAAARPPEGEIEARRAGGRAALAAMERHLAARTYLVGEAYSVADIALYAYTHVPITHR